MGTYNNQKQKLETNQFMGYVHRPYCPDGAFYDVQNLCTDDYPIISTKDAFQKIQNLPDNQVAAIRKYLVIGATVKDCLITFSLSSTSETTYVIDVFYEGGHYSQSLDVGFNVWTGRSDYGYPSEKWYAQQQAVSMGNDIILYPAKLKLRWVTIYGETSAVRKFIAEDLEAGSYLSGNIQMVPCDREGNEYTGTVSDEEPEDKEEGSVWIDISNGTITIKKYSSMAWNTVPQVYTKIKFNTAVDRNGSFQETSQIEFSKIDTGDVAVFDWYINGTNIVNGLVNCVSTGDTGTATAKALEDMYGENEIIKRDTGYVIVTGVIAGTLVMSSGVSAIMRRMLPRMDFICECNNRLWGCRYGEDNNKYLPYRDQVAWVQEYRSKGKDYINELYCCQLGNPRRWRNYSGISTDSWAASNGTDGPWTGCIAYNGYPLFFKKHSMTKIYISSTGAHQTVDYKIDGPFQSNYAERNTQITELNGALYFVGRNGIYVYDGSTPAKLSAPIGDYPFTYAQITASDKRVYVFCQTEEKIKTGSNYINHSMILEYDPTNKIWWKHSGALWVSNEVYDNIGKYIWASAKWNGGLFVFSNMAAYTMEKVFTSSTWLSEAGGGTYPIYWEATSGIQYWQTPEKKYISKFSFRIDLEEGATFNLELEYDSSGEWISAGSITADRHGCHTLPVIPRRCDHMRYRISGTGMMKLFSITREYEGSTEK